MKKILYLLIVPLIGLSVSACTLDKEEAPVTNTPSNLTNNVAPSAKPVSPATPSQQQVNNNKNMKSIDQQEDLVKQYSQAIIKTNLGDVTLEFYGEDSPITVNNFLNLAKKGFYDGLKFHRIIKGFMIQGGDPITKTAEVNLYGTGGPGYKFQDEFNNHKLVAGSLAMANSGPGTNGSQFFIVTAEETPWLDGRHTNFGKVVAGLDVVKKIEAVETGVNDRPLEDVVILKVELIK